MKKCFVLLLSLSTFSALGNPEFMTVKERLRLSLWFEGIEQKVETPAPEKLPLPEELEIPLQKN